MTAVIGALVVLSLLVLAWVVARIREYRIGPVTRALESHDIVCVESGRRPRWALQARDGSDVHPVPEEKPAPSVSAWGHSVTTLDEEAPNAA